MDTGHRIATQLVTSTSSSDQLSACASLSSDRKKLYLLLVNKSPGQDASVGGGPWHDDTFAAGMAVDDDPTTRWASDFFVKAPQWLRVDLGQAPPFDQVRLRWEYWSTAYDVQVSDDGTSWRTVATRSDASILKPEPQPIDEITLDQPVTARYVRISMTGRPAQSGSKAGASQWTPDGFSLWEVAVYLTR